MGVETKPDAFQALMYVSSNEMKRASLRQQQPHHVPREGPADERHGPAVGDVEQRRRDVVDEGDPGGRGGVIDGGDDDVRTRVEGDDALRCSDSRAAQS